MAVQETSQGRWGDSREYHNSGLRCMGSYTHRDREPRAVSEVVHVRRFLLNIPILFYHIPELLQALVAASVELEGLVMEM